MCQDHVLSPTVPQAIVYHSSNMIQIRNETGTIHNRINIGSRSGYERSGSEPHAKFRAALSHGRIKKRRTYDTARICQEGLGSGGGHLRIRILHRCAARARGAGAGGRDDRTLLRRRKKIRALFIPLTLAAGSSSPSSLTSFVSSPFLEQRSPLSWC